MRKLAFAAALGAAAIALAAASLAGGQGGKSMVKADTLTGYQEATPAGVSSPTGTGSFEAVIDDTSIAFELRYSGLSAPALQSHIHFGNRFTSGGISAFLCGPGHQACPAGTTTEAVVTGTITAADVIGPTSQGIAPGEFDELVAAIRAGVTYANVHTAPFPAGEIRGQINDDNQRQP